MSAKPQVIPHLSEDTGATLFDCLWVPCSPRFVVTGTKPSGKGLIRVYSMGAKELTVLDETSTSHAVKCGTFGHSSLEERHLATGDFSGSLCTWDLEKLGEPVTRIEKAHDDFINAIDGFGGLGNAGGGKGAPKSPPRRKTAPLKCGTPGSKIAPWRV